MRYLPVALLLLATPALAQDPATTSQPPVPQEEPKAAADAKPPAKRATTAQPKVDERFTPSESISEDLSVSFPSDI